MQPSQKSEGIASFLEQLAGRTTAITSDKCVNPPFGCGGDAVEFKSAKSRREYTISGLCQKCQDRIFK